MFKPKPSAIVLFALFSQMSLAQASDSSQDGSHSLESPTSLNSNSEGEELVVEVKASKRLIEKSSTASQVNINKETIQTLPQGDQVKLSKLIASTTPGVIEGPFGALFIRGNHGNVLYLIDGVQLPDSPSNTFAEPFSTRNIDHMEIITGGIPAEFGERLTAVVAITSKSGPEEPSGTAELNYGTYDRFSPQLTYGGSNESGTFHYFLSGNYTSTSRGLDTPQPLLLSESSQSVDQTQGGTDSIHNQAYTNSQFVRLDWQLDNENKFTLSASNSYAQYQIPNFPSTFSSSNWIFQNTGDAPAIRLPSLWNERYSN